MLRLHTADATSSGGDPASPAGAGRSRAAPNPAVAERVRALRAELRALGAGGSLAAAPSPRVGRDPVARLLGGRAALTELLPDPRAGGPGGAAAAWGLAVGLAAAAVRDSGEGGGVVAVVCRGRGGPFPPGWAAAGVRRVIWVRPATERDRLWALERCLRCGGLAATVGFLPAGVGDVAGRRLALAAAAGGGANVLLRPAAAAREACWADVRLAAAEAPGPGDRAGGSPSCGPPAGDSPRPRWRVRVLRRRGLVTDDLERGLILERTDDAALAEPAPPAARPAALGNRRAAGDPAGGRHGPAGAGPVRVPAGLAGPADPRRPAAGPAAARPRRRLARAG